MHAMYVPDTNYSGEIYPTNNQVDEEDSGYDEEDRAPDDAEPVVPDSDQLTTLRMVGQRSLKRVQSRPDSERARRSGDDDFETG